MQQSSLSTKLLKKVLSVYFILTFTMTLLQIGAEYYNAKNFIKNELNTLQQTFSGSLTRALWELNTPQTVNIADGLLAIPSIEGIVIRDDNGEIVARAGRYIDIQQRFSNQLVEQTLSISEQQSGIFGYTFPLIFEFSGRVNQVGDVTLFSSRHIVLERIKVSLYFVLGNAMIKTTFLIILFMLAFRKYLTEPLAELSLQIEQLEPEQLDDAKIRISPEHGSELTVVANAYNQLLERLQGYQDQLKKTEQKLVQSNEQLDQQNLMLEQEVARKTAGLSRAMMDLQQQKQELLQKKQSLREEIEQRRNTEQHLRDKHQELQDSIDTLQLAQDRLQQSEKMAALGGLVAGISHEVNTPVGIGVTAASFLAERLQQLTQAYQDKALTPKMLEDFLNEAQQSTTLLQSNLSRASELIASFKQVAVDQASDAIRTINLQQYLHDILRSLQPHFKKTQHQIDITCPDDIVLECPAGAISQILTNLLMNSLIHGFEGMTEGKIRITVREAHQQIHLHYSDNGNGITSHQLEQLFNPFFTTKRDEGGSGLGTHITYNLVKQTLGGTIEVSSKPGQGLHYHICFPKKSRLARVT